MTSLKDLKKNSGLLSKQLAIDKVIFNAAIDLLEKGKIPKPDKVFKDTVPKLNRKAKYPFLFLDMGQKKYFLLGDSFPMGNELTKKIEETKKLLSKAKKPAEKEVLEQLSFFYQELDGLNPKGFATGIVRFSREQQNKETAVLEHLMAVKTSGLKVGGAVKKGSLVQLVREELGYSLTSKLGEVIFLEEETEETTIEEGVARTAPVAGELESVTDEVKQLLEQFKAVKPKQAFKSLGLIHKMTTLIESLEEAPSNLQNLVKKLGQQQAKFAPVLSKQIDGKLDQSMTELEELPTIASTTQLEEIFSTVLKMYEGWKVFLEEAHPQAADIEKIGEEIDLLKEYEAKIVPLRRQFEQLEEGEEKSQLGEQINALIEEAKEAIG